MPDLWMVAWEEANASVPPDMVICCTLELRHPVFAWEGEPVAIRIPVYGL